MFNSKARREAVKKLNRSVKRYEAIRKQIESASVDLHKLRQNVATRVIHQVESYVNTLANSPKEFDTSVTEFRVATDRFHGIVKRIESDVTRSIRIGSAAGAAGVAAGVGVAALGPSAAMVVATTFGTASTGTAISALSGAAATNAALAWLGGGAIATGGSGMAGGSALLALAGPVGWGIGGVALLGSGLYFNNGNKSHARIATEARIEVESKIRSLQTAIREIDGLREGINKHVEGCLLELDWLLNYKYSGLLQFLRSQATKLFMSLYKDPADYRNFNQEQKERLAALINHIRSLSELLRTEVTL